MNTENRRKGLSETESRLLSSLAERGKTIFTLQSLISETDFKLSYENAKVIVNRLVKKKWLIRIARGKYLIVPLEAGVRSEYTEHEYVVASHLAEPYYIGYWSALNYHGLTEQIPMTVYVITTKRLKDRKILDTRYRFITLIERKFFGYKSEVVSNTKINISDMEKTLADCLDHLEYCGGVDEVAEGIWNAREDVSTHKIVDYGIRLGNSTILKRLGFLLETLQIEVSQDIMGKIKSNLKKGYVLLDPLEEKRGQYSTKWGLLVNISKKRVKEWRRGY